MSLEDKVTRERKFGELTLEELKEVYEACTSDFMCCDKKCPLFGVRKDRLCIKALQKSVLELIEAYKTVLPVCEHWFKRADALSDKANKYDSVRNELIRTQELLKNSQDECRKRAEKIKDMREEIDALRNEVVSVNAIHDDLNCKLEKAEAARKSLEDEVESLNVTLDLRQHVIDQLMKEARETSEDLFDYHALKNALQVVGEAMRGDQSGDHEKD